MVDQHFLELCKLRANWYMTSATTGHAVRTTMHHSDGTPYTDAEKLDRAMDIAKSHIQLYQDHVDTYAYTKD